jgi:hypothetical protein
MKRSRIQTGLLIVLIVIGGVVLVKRQAVLDWWKLRGYTPPAAVVELAADDTMTPEAEHLLYVNHPDITAGQAFTSHCPAGGEKTVVLGCYVGNDTGIYIYKVTDSRLDGVEQVTAAHEMLHAAYRRLSNSERAKVDAMLTDYYEHDLTDQRIKDTIAAYKQSEPHDVVNEMHSVFGTEIPNLPAPLEQYYRQYFTDRAKVAAYTAQYQGEFTSRQAAVADYDAELSSLKSQITANEAQLSQQNAALSAQAAQMRQERASGQLDAYNSAVPGYNAAVNSYNSLLAATKDLINQYNNIVDKRNAVALEEQQLSQALSPKALPAAQ